jgi:hypothetical protein
MQCRALRLRELLRVFGFAMVLVASASTNTQENSLGVTERMVVASRIYAMITQYFAHWEGAPRREIEAAYREYIEHAIGALHRKDFDLATMRFSASLRA